MHSGKVIFISKIKCIYMFLVTHLKIIGSIAANLLFKPLMPNCMNKGIHNLCLCNTYSCNEKCVFLLATFAVN